MKQGVKCISRWLMAAFSMVFLIMGSQVSASETKGPSLPFEVKPLPSSNQEKGVGSYFSLKTTPNQKLTVYLELKNIVEKDVTVVLKPADALTIKNGGIQLTDEETNPSSSFIDDDFKMKDNIQVQTEVILKKGEERKVPVQITAPNSKDGVFVGGLLISEKENPEAEKNKEGFFIVNKTVLGISVQLLMPNPVNPSMKIEDSKIEFSPSGVIVSTKVQNDSAAVIKNMEVAYTVYNEKKEEIFSGEQIGFKMAPMTDVWYPIFWNSEKISAGNYYVKTTLTLGDAVVEKENKFYIPEKEVSQYEKENKVMKPSIEKEVIPTWIWMVMAGLIGAILLIVIFTYVLYRRKNRR